MQSDMKSIIQAAVAEAVEKTLGRQLELQERQVELLERIARFLGVEPGRAQSAPVQKRTPAPVPTAKHAPAPEPAATPKRTPSVPVRKYVRPEAAPKPTRAGPSQQKSRGRPRAAGRTAPAAAPSSSPSPETPASYSEGQEVRYKQGRGTFSAKVKAIDEKAKTLTLERVSDGTKVVRPFDKVTPA
ncbi:PspA [Myxococcus sp. AB036A]|uniref:PspA n=1 Tax=Myxococcus sp. AB036A TaxID=2562793 RepID=UPI00114798AC|nr:PspA [Myxococcus sp. AB036A]